MNRIFQFSDILSVYQNESKAVRNDDGEIVIDYSVGMDYTTTMQEFADWLTKDTGPHFIFAGSMSEFAEAKIPAIHVRAARYLLAMKYYSLSGNEGRFQLNKLDKEKEEVDLVKIDKHVLRGEPLRKSIFLELIKKLNVALNKNPSVWPKWEYIGQKED